ncbi:hypothetical protein [Methanobrevibacter millerae]|uniref:Transposase n=1 Tax=Methanobrevibacter millerae TaxID=230361 RepID=A0A1G5WYD1_9EURY|nr:hypothetical protein [Methanobrevibacter millerae]SDA62676.1 hypothetical protein SAMN02910315_01772 [Methanobrevibacter millerae]
MAKEIKGKYVPVRSDAEDEIHIICMSQLEEYPEYLTKLDDIVGGYESRFVSERYKNLNLDSVRQRKNGNLINIEHHSSIDADLMRRDYEYCISTHAATKRYVEPFIFYTGDLPIKEVDFANDLMFFNPKWIKSKERCGSIRLNNLKYKIEKQEKCSAFEILDLIWLPKYQNDINFVDTILECVKLYKHVIGDEWVLYVAKKCLRLWVGRHVEDEEQLIEAVGGLDMSALELRPFEEQFANVLLANKLDQAEKRGKEQGKEQGIEQGEENIILKLLKKNSPEEISAQYDIPLEKIRKIEESK